MSSPPTFPASDHHPSAAMPGRGKIRILNVVEKPSVAKSVAEILSRRGGGMKSREQRSRYNRIFEFKYAIGGQLCHMLITSMTGYLMEIDFDERFHKWHSCDSVDLYHVPICKYVPQDKLNLKCMLEEEARRCQWLVLWLDYDGEVENIAFEVVKVCTSVNSHLDIWRARFSALIDRDTSICLESRLTQQIVCKCSGCKTRNRLENWCIIYRVLDIASKRYICVRFCWG